MSVRIITDSTADIRPALVGQIPFVSLNIRFGEEEYSDGVTMSRKEFYEHLQVCKELPATSQPSPELFAEAYEAALNAGDEVIVITISSKLSGTFQSANIAAMDFDNGVYVIDSENACIGAGVLAEYAKQLADSGMSGADIAATLNAEKKNLRLFATLDTLEYLVRGGRLSRVAGVAGGLLNIKPVITINGGSIEVVGKARGMKQGNAMMLKEIEKSGGIDFTKPVLSGFTGLSDDLLQKFLAEAQAKMGSDMALDSTIISGTIGTHVGPGAFAVAYFKK